MGLPERRAYGLGRGLAPPPPPPPPPPPLCMPPAASRRLRLRMAAGEEVDSVLKLGASSQTWLG